MRADKLSLDPSNLDPSFDFVFRDFELSKLAQIRRTLAADRGPFSLIYLAIAMFWTAGISYGAVAHGNSEFAVNLSPHVAFYTLIIGIILYPLRKIWIPIAAFSMVYFIPFSLPLANGSTWLTLSRGELNFVVAIYFYHIVSGSLIAIMSMHVALQLQRLSPPYSLDLLNVLTLFCSFVVMCALQAWVFWTLAQWLSPSQRLELGFGPEYIAAAIERILRGGVVVGGFLLGVLEVSSRGALLKGIVASVAFLALAVAHKFGYALYPTLDTCLLALLLTTVLPYKIGISACIVGIPIHSALTGTFVSTSHMGDPFQTKLEYLAIMMLIVIVLSPTLRAHTMHLLRQREGAMRRLSMVRDFADVGLLSFNLERRLFRTDTSVQRILGTQSLGSIAEFLALFETQDRQILQKSLSETQSGSVNLLMTRHVADNQVQVLRICLWYEIAPSGEKVAYGLVLDVTGEHQQERALQETLAELSLRQERQRQLFSIISHELRTPASVVSMLIEDLPSRHIPVKMRKQLREATDQLLTTLADMRQTVNPSQNLPITLTAYAPADLADSIRNMFEPRAREQGMTIKLALCDAARISRYGDQMRLRQAITNVVRNAIIHSKGSLITLRYDAVERSGQPISLWTITDNGKGIAPDQIERLFHPFERGTQDPKNPVDGSGLGLYIAKSSIEMLGGKITQFAPSGGGTGFYIELPEATAETTPPPPAEKIIAKKHARYPNFYVLLAEDNALVAEVTLAKLSRFVGRVEVVGNGRDALQKISDDLPDLVITDLFMPEMSGDDMIAMLRKKGCDVPIIGLTAAAVGDDIHRLEQAGATAVMIKPLDISAIRDVIDDIAARTRKRPPRSKAKI